jgi:hypothetical protein
MENEQENDNEHKFLLRIDEDLWKRFIDKLPVSISANQKVVDMIFDFVVKYELVMGDYDDKNTKKRQDGKSNL